MAGMGVRGLLLLRIISLSFTLTFGAAAESFGDPGHQGVRAGTEGDRSEQDAVQWELAYKADLMGKLSGEGRRGYALDNLDIKVSINGDRLAGLHDTTALLRLLSNHGGKPGLKFDRLPAGMDNIETPYNANTSKIYEAWVERGFADGAASLRVGLYDINSEFYVTDASGVFLQPTFGIGTELGTTGKNGPSIFPTTSAGVRARLQPGSGSFLQAAVLDGVPGDPHNPAGTHIKFEKGDGALWVAEGGVNGDDGKLAGGIWRYTSRFADLLDRNADGAPAQRLSRGLYLLSELSLWRANEASVRGFLRLGKNDGDTVQFDSSASGGLTFQGLLPGRPTDEFGIAFSRLRNSAKFRSANPGLSTFELTLEATYRLRATPWLAVQPDLQYLAKHASDPRQDHTWYGGMRFELSF